MRLLAKSSQSLGILARWGHCMTRQGTTEWISATAVVADPGKDGREG